MKEIRIQVDDTLYDRLVNLCKEAGISPQDVLIYALRKAIEMLEGKKR